jgi:hypothetical protein
LSDTVLESDIEKIPIMDRLTAFGDDWKVIAMLHQEIQVHVGDG